MNASTTWDRIWAQRENPCQWPWSDVITYVNRYCPKNIRVLEIGCGAGANMPFFVERGDFYCGVEVSPVAVAEFRSRQPKGRDAIVCADFTKDLGWAMPFDLVLDRGALTHCAIEHIAPTLKMIYDQLVPGGKLITIDFFSLVTPVTTLDDYGTVTMVGMKHIKHLYAQHFDLEALDFKLLSSTIEDKQIGTFNVVAVKRG